MRETPYGAEDVLQQLIDLDARGLSTLVEVKRTSDTRGPRDVVAQMLDYATLIDAFGVDDVDGFWQMVDTI